MSQFPLKIVTPDGLIFDGPAEKLIVRSTGGDVAILARHVNYVTPLGMGRAVIVTNGQRRTAACIGGLLSVVDGEVTLVPTHGDWQPRNWLIDEGTVRVIDFGRADLRPALEDLARLARQDFARDPALEDAFLSGYGADPREAGLWRRTLVVEAIATAAWAHGVGDEDFEQVGLQQISRLLG